jgi:superfamily II DNA or RNA helicase
MKNARRWYMLKIRLSNHIELFNAPDELYKKTIEDNTFYNPNYRENEAQGRSNWKTSQYITTYSQSNKGLYLPRGYLADLLALCKKESIAFEIEDCRVTCPAIFQPLKGITLRPYQQRAVKSALQNEQGVIVSPTGSGKSLIGLEIIRKCKQKAIILLHRGELAKQWVAIIKERLGLDAGFIGAGECRVSNEITVAMVQSLATQQKVFKEFFLDFGLILTDECHHIPAKSFFEVIGNFTTRYRYALSATPQRRDGLEPLIYRAIGPAIAVIDKTEVEKLGATVPTIVEIVDTDFKPQNCDSWADYQTAIATSERRNKLIADGLQRLQGPTLVLVDRIKHAGNISKLLSENNVAHTLTHGRLKSTERRTAMEAMRTSKITVGTTSLLGEGLDFPAWCTLILASPISSEIKLLQAIGRITRAAPGKHQAIVYDLRDDCGFAGSSFKKRFEIYKKHKILVEFPKRTKPLINGDQAALTI